MEEGMECAGAVEARGDVPCLSCGFGDDCKVSGPKMLFGPEATIASTPVKSFRENPQAPAAAQELGQGMGEALRA
jgi:hypothetical protein